MSLIKQLTLVVVTLTLADTLKILQKQNEVSSKDDDNSIRRFLDLLTSSERLNKQKGSKIKKAKELYEALAKQFTAKELRDMILPQKSHAKETVLRSKKKSDKKIPSDTGKTVEDELKKIVMGAHSSLLDTPYVEQAGLRDFLVMRDSKGDTHVTVVPNSIYYNIEKKCVNWLDDCSLQGIRAKLLNKISSPFR